MSQVQSLTLAYAILDEILDDRHACYDDGNGLRYQTYTDTEIRAGARRALIKIGVPERAINLRSSQ